MHASDRLDLSKQLTARIIKEEILSDKTVLAVSENYIDALYYNEMFYSAACWNTSASVDRELKNMNSKSPKLLDLKDNIKMTVIGLG